MSQVFISYKKEERDTAEEFRTHIEGAGFKVWMDPDQPAGKEWRGNIDREIKKSIALVVIMTDAAKSSAYVTYEWAFAYGAGVRVIPVIHIDPNDLHPRLGYEHYRDFRGGRRPWKLLLKDLKDADTASSLRIHAALWGPNRFIYDVSNKVKKNVSDGRVNMHANIDAFQDPFPGEKKTLYVFYSNHGVTDTEFVLEEEDLNIG